jgi:hypothetical protein
MAHHEFCHFFSTMDKQLQPWHIYTAIFVAFWAMSAYFDNFFVTAILCVAGGFGADTFRQYLAGSLEPTAVKDDAPTKPLPPEPESETEPEASIQAEEVPIQ